jgi:hypothetical protein
MSRENRSLHGGDPTPSKNLEADIILTSHPGYEGAWVRRITHYSERQMITVLEMAVGRRALYMHEDRLSTTSTYFYGQKVKIADERQWAFLCGLVLCNQAERIAL